MMANSVPHSGWRRWSLAALWVDFGVVTIAIACFGGLDARVWAPLGCALVLVLAAIVTAAVIYRRRLVWHPLLIPVLAFGVLVALQWGLGWSVYPGATLTGMLQLGACGAGFYLALLTFRTGSHIRPAGTALWILAGVLAGEAIAQYFTAFRDVYWYRPALYATPVGPFIYHNHFAGCMDLLLPFAIVVAFRPDGRGSLDDLARLRRGIIPALCLISIVISQSRGGLFAVGVEGLLALALGWRSLRSSRSLRRGVALGALLLAASAALTNWGPMVQRLSNLGAQDVSVAQRLQVDLSCLAIWRDYPWLGSGFNTFSTIYPKYQRFDSGLQFLQAHDEYAQALAETGAVGIACVIGFLLLFLLACGRAWRSTAAPGALYQKAAFVACAGFLFHSAGDFQFHAFANALLFFFCAGLAAARVRRSSTALPALPRHAAAAAGPDTPFLTKP